MHSETGLNISKVKPTRKRFFILSLICLITFINYLDRTNISVAAPFLSKDLALNAVQMGVVFSAMSWAYTATQIPTGWILDRFGSRLIYGIALLGWSIFTFAISTASGLKSLIGFRLGLGFFEAPAFPANNRIVSAWFPAKERGIAVGAYTGAEYLGLAFCTPILIWLLSRFGWRSIFISTGVLGILCTLVWFKFYRDPVSFKGVNQEELGLIKDGGGFSDTLVEKRKVTWKEMKPLFTNRTLWGMYLGGFCENSVKFFFITWFPSYLVTAKHMTILKLGIYGSLPYMAAIVGVLLAGRGSDWMLSKGYGLSLSRKLPIIIGLLLICASIGGNYTNNVNIVITLMCISFFGQGAAATINWTLLSDVSPKELVGTCGSTYNFITNIGGSLCPLIIGFLISSTGSYVTALIYISALGLVGALSYIFIVGKPERIVINH